MVIGSGRRRGGGPSDGVGGARARRRAGETCVYTCVVARLSCPSRLLDDPQVRPAVEEVRREAVAERVRRDAGREARDPPQAVEPVAQAADAQRVPEMIEEELGGFIDGADARIADGAVPAGCGVDPTGLAARRRAARTGLPSSTYAASASLAGRPSNRSDPSAPCPRPGSRRARGRGR